MLCSTAPSEPPQNVSATVLASTAIRVYWDEVPAIDKNGRILFYEVEYNQSRFAPGSSSLTVTNLTAVLEGLHESVVYSVRIRARTSQGYGPYSETVVAMTLEDGELIVYSTAAIQIKDTERTIIFMRSTAVL